MEKDEEKDLFENENKILKNCYKIIDILNNPDNEEIDLKNEYKNLVINYEKLLKQAKKILKISDNQQKILSKQKSELQELNNKKNEFIGIASHDLRSPIAIIQLYSKFIIESMSSNLTEKQISYLTVISDLSNFMLKLINDILDISSIEAGNLRLNMDKYNYIQVVKKNIDLNREIANNKNIKIDLVYNNIDEDSLFFLFDKDKIEQVLNNLLTNAIKYSFPDTTIIVEISIIENYVVTKVIDKGQGIMEKELPLIFNPFHKSINKPTKGEKSTGLGLAIVKKIIEGHNGEVGVESKFGVGSMFYFKLPVK